MTKDVSILKKLLYSRTFYIVLILFTLIYTFIFISIPKKSKYTPDENKLEGIVTSYKFDGDKLTFILNGKEKLKCNYYFDRESEKEEYVKHFKYGSRIKISGTLSTPSNNTIPNTFNYRKYLYYHNIFYICNASEISIDNDTINLLYKIKNYVIDRINSYKIKDYLLTFIIGDKSLLENETLDTYRTNGITHLFSVSGMHIGLFNATILLLLKKVNISTKKRYLITISFIWFYAFLTGFTKSILRAGLLFSILSINKLFKLEMKSIYCLVITGVILCIFNPFITMDIGFIYSFLTTFVLMFASEALKKHKIIGTSLIAFFASLPITINNFYEINFLSIVLNVIFVPLVSIIIYPLCMLSFIFRFLEPITSLFLDLLELMSFASSKISFFKIISPKMNIITLLIYYMVLFGLINKKFKICIVILFSIVILSTKTYIFDKSYNVDFLNVGQGDSTLIRYPQNKETILIDTGGIVTFSKEKWQEKDKFNISDNIIIYMYSLGIKN